MKACFKCGEVKPLTEFYKHDRMGDGHLNKCKECTKKDVRTNRIVSENAREYDRRRYRDDPERRAYTASVAKRWMENNPEKYVAHYTLTNAVRDGRKEKLDRCEICGRSGKIHGHHEDYSKPLEVMWLCPQCHNGRHANR